MCGAPELIMMTLLLMMMLLLLMMMTLMMLMRALFLAYPSHQEERHDTPSGYHLDVSPMTP